MQNTMVNLLVSKDTRNVYSMSSPSASRVSVYQFDHVSYAKTMLCLKQIVNPLILRLRGKH